MLVRDFPRWLRGVLVVTIFLFLINAIIFLVGVVAIVALIQTSPVASGVIGAVLGAAFTYAGTKLLDRGRRQNETRDVTEMRTCRARWLVTRPGTLREPFRLDWSLRLPTDPRYLGGNELSAGKHEGPRGGQPGP